MDAVTRKLIERKLATKYGYPLTLDKEAVLDNLTEARDLLARPYGWIKGRMTGINHGEEAYCSVGAIMKANGKGQDAASIFLTVAINYSIIPWNDTSGRKKKDVIQAFNDAIALVEDYA